MCLLLLAKALRNIYEDVMCLIIRSRKGQPPPCCPVEFLGITSWGLGGWKCSIKLCCFSLGPPCCFLMSYQYDGFVLLQGKLWVCEHCNWFVNSKRDIFPIKDLSLTVCVLRCVCMGVWMCRFVYVCVYTCMSVCMCANGCVRKTVLLWQPLWN